MVEGAGICIVLPAGYAVGRTHPGLQLFEHPDAPPITVRWNPVSVTSAQAHAKALARLADLDPSAVVGPTADGVGTFAYAVETQAGNHQVTHAASTLRTGDHEVWCSASAPTSAALPRAFYEACQSLLVAPSQKR